MTNKIQKKTSDEVLNKLLDFFKTKSNIADKCKLRPQAVYCWFIYKRIPSNRVLQLEHLTKGKITRFEMRPDLYEDYIESK